MSSTLGFDHESDFNALLELYITLVQALAGQQIKVEDAWLNDRQALAIKLYRHLHSMRQVATGSALTFQGTISPFIDHASVKILMRAALETYLVFYFIFRVDELEVSRFRHMTWKLGGLLERQRLHPITDFARRVHETELIQIAQLRSEIASHPVINMYTARERKAIHNGEWRTGKAWRDLAVNAGFHPVYFGNIYNYLCGYSHSSYASALQVIQGKTIEEQRELSGTMFGIACMVAAHFAFTYASLFDLAQQALNSIPSAKAVVEKWRFNAKNMDRIYKKIE
jgi:hypothetical protein